MLKRQVGIGARRLWPLNFEAECFVEAIEKINSLCCSKAYILSCRSLLNICWRSALLCWSTLLAWMLQDMMSSTRFQQSTTAFSYCLMWQVPNVQMPLRTSCQQHIRRRSQEDLSSMHIEELRTGCVCVTLLRQWQLAKLAFLQM